MTMAAAAWSAIIRIQADGLARQRTAVNAARTPRTESRWTSGCPANPRIPSARTQSGPGHPLREAIGEIRHLDGLPGGRDLTDLAHAEGNASEKRR